MRTRLRLASARQIAESGMAEEQSDQKFEDDDDDEKDSCAHFEDEDDDEDDYDSLWPF